MSLNEANSINRDLEQRLESDSAIIRQSCDGELDRATMRIQELMVRYRTMSAVMACFYAFVFR